MHLILDLRSSRDRGHFGPARFEPSYVVGKDCGSKKRSRLHFAECLIPQILYTSSASSRFCGSKQGFLCRHCMCMYYGSST